MPKTKKSLILYQSTTGNTEKIALSFKKVFEKRGWDCEMFKVDKKTDTKKPPFDFQDYDFLCAGSGVYKHLPPQEIVDIMFFVTHPPREAGHEATPPGRSTKVTKIVPGPKPGIVFATFSGLHLGPKEAEPALSLLELEMEHLKFKCVGKFSCRGKFGQIQHLINRPSERDLHKAEIFLEEILEELD
jgi:flavodoxin